MAERRKIENRQPAIAQTNFEAWQSVGLNDDSTPVVRPAMCQRISGTLQNAPGIEPLLARMPKMPPMMILGKPGSAGFSAFSQMEGSGVQNQILGPKTPRRSPS
jgi:hypothetical protein